MRKRILRDNGLRLILIIGLTLREGALLRYEIFRIAFFVRVAIEVALERLLLVEPVTPVHAGLVYSGILRLRGHDNTVIVFRMLQIVLGGHRIAGRHRIPGERSVLLRDMHRGSANLHIRTARFVVPADGILGFTAAAITASAALLSLPHGSYLV